MTRAPAFLLIAVSLPGCSSLPVGPTSAQEAERTGVCHVHHVPMAKKRTPIVYGLVASPMGRAYEAQVAEFPFAHRQVLGGCVFMVAEPPGNPDLSSPTFAEIPICAECDTAKASWIRWHPWDPWAKTWRHQLAHASSEASTPPATPPAGG